MSGNLGRVDQDRRMLKDPLWWISRFTGISTSDQPKIDDLESGLEARKTRRFSRDELHFQRHLNEL